MRKFLSIICVTAMLLSFSACGNSTESVSDSEIDSIVEKKSVDYDFDDYYDGAFLRFPISSEWQIEKNNTFVTYENCEFSLPDGTKLKYISDETKEKDYSDKTNFTEQNDDEFMYTNVHDGRKYKFIIEKDKLEPASAKKILEYITDNVEFKEIPTEAPTELPTEKPTEPPTEPPTPAPTEDPAVVEQEYKSQCQALTYKDLARDRDGLIGTYVTFTGEIIQDAGEGAYRMAVTKEGTYTTYYTDPIMIYYNDNGVGDRILKDDIVTIWGQSGGLYSYETVMGDTVTVPLVYVEYVELVEG